MRPHYSTEELNMQCESILFTYLQKRYGRVVFPIRTDDLRYLLERDTQHLDLHSDFTKESEQVEVVAEFRRGRKLVVRIAAKLAGTPAL
jgi:hypothetical protein